MNLIMYVFFVKREILLPETPLKVFKNMKAKLAEIKTCYTTD